LKSSIIQKACIIQSLFTKSILGGNLMNQHSVFRLKRVRTVTSWLVVVLAVLSLCLTTLAQQAFAATTVAAPTVYTGTLGGADYKIEIPANWNGTLLLYSHGYVVPGQPNPARDMPDPISGAYLLAQGYATAGSAYSASGWALEQAFTDQIALLDYFKSKFGQPKRTIAWGTSLGGIITAGLLQRNPERFNAALPMCGVLQGGPEAWNSGLDGTFILKNLLAPSSALELTHFTKPSQDLALLTQLVDTAQTTAQGRARLALAATVSGGPTWFDPASAEPSTTDYATRELNQELWIKNVNAPFFTVLRAELEARAGGNPSYNVGVNYAQLVANLPQEQQNMVQALYSQAGLDLKADLALLDKTPRISADSNALAYIQKYITLNGQIKVPMLTLHTTGDGLVPVRSENSFAQQVANAGDAVFLRQLFIHRAGHCTFTPAEVLTSFQLLVKRLDSGTWSDTSNIDALNSSAASLGSSANVWFTSTGLVPTASAFIAYNPPNMTRFYGNTYTETGFSLNGTFLNYWTANGGVPVFGFPIAPARTDGTGQTYQWLERNRLEAHSDNAAPYNVLLGLLGEEALAKKGIDWKTLPTVSTAPSVNCVYFAQTHHSLCDDFLTYWQSHGLQLGDGTTQSMAASLALFGYPISEPKMETNSSGETVLTQWFERARLELHPNNPQLYRVELGRLGAELYNPTGIVPLSSN
jgi:dienelactone hydrolase